MHLWKEGKGIPPLSLYSQWKLYELILCLGLWEPPSPSVLLSFITGQLPCCKNGAWEIHLSPGMTSSVRFLFPLNIFWHQNKWRTFSTINWFVVGKWLENTQSLQKPEASHFRPLEHSTAFSIYCTCTF